MRKPNLGASVAHAVAALLAVSFAAPLVLAGGDTPCSGCAGFRTTPPTPCPKAAGFPSPACSMECCCCKPGATWQCECQLNCGSGCVINPIE